MAVKSLIGPDSVVIVANTFNPSIFDKHWYVTKDIIEEGQIEAQPIAIPQFSQISTVDYIITVTLNQLQLQCKNQEAFEAFVPSVLSRIVQKLPEIPYSALGFNFGFQCKGSEEEVKDLSHKLFRHGNSEFIKEFQDDSFYGTFLVKKFEEARLTVEGRINELKEDKGNERHSLSFNFNFHWNLSRGNEVKEMLDIIQKAKNYHYEANRLIQLLK